MSVTPTQPTDEETYECSHCGGDRRPSTSVAGSFCSTACHRAHKRAKQAGRILEILEHDHRFCKTCGRQLKTVDKPDTTLVVGPCEHQEWGHAKDVLVGYQYRTEHADQGEISMDVDEAGDRPIVERGVATGTVCRCGNTAHQHGEAIIRDRFPFETAYFLHRAARTLRAEDKHDVQLDRRQLFDAVVDQAVPVEDSNGLDIRAAIADAVVLND